MALLNHNRQRLRTGLFGALLVGLAACGSGSHPHAAPSPSTTLAPCDADQHARPSGPSDTPPPVPRHGLVGAFTLTGPASQENLTSSFTSLQTAVCHRLTMAHVYLRWKDHFPSQSALALSRSASYLLVSWTGTTLSSMASGDQDAEITARARQIASLHRPVYLELRWEMDRPNLAATVGSPETFIAAWKRTRQLFATAGVHNVSWVWCPTSAGFADGRAQPFYPGADQVDWVCADAYPATLAAPTEFPSLASLVRPFLDWAKMQGKPEMIGEFGIPQSYPAEQRAAWLDGARQLVDQTPRIKAMLYFDYADPGTIASHNYALGNDPAVVSAFRRLSADARLGG